MAFVGYTKTERNPLALVKGWLWISTTINTGTDIIQHYCNGSMHYRREVVGEGINIYCHDDAAPEPITDGEIRTSVFDDAEVEYSGPAGVIHSFTSAGSFFSFDQSMNVGSDWTIYYNAKVSGVTGGWTPFIIFSFYKRDTGDNDTFLWSQRAHVGTLYNIFGLDVDTTPVGSVTTADRLRIRVTMSQEAG